MKKVVLAGNDTALLCKTRSALARVTRTIGPAVLLVAAGCAAPSNTGPIATGAEAEAQRIVRRNEVPTGSRLSKRTCMTAQEWEEQAAQAREEKRNMRRAELPKSSAPSIGN